MARSSDSAIGEQSDRPVGAGPGRERRRPSLFAFALGAATASIVALWLCGGLSLTDRAAALPGTATGRSGAPAEDPVRAHAEVFAAVSEIRVRLETILSRLESLEAVVGRGLGRLDGTANSGDADAASDDRVATAATAERRVVAEAVARHRLELLTELRQWEASLDGVRGRVPPGESEESLLKQAHREIEKLTEALRSLETGRIRTVEELAAWRSGRTPR